MGVRFFTDRSLGDHVVPEALRAAGWVVVSMRERYGNLTAQSLADIDWITDATAEGEVLLTGDKAIAKRPLEAQAVVESGARVFALGSSQLTGPQKAQRFIDQQPVIARRAQGQAGPYVVSVTARGLVTLKLFS
ncbi:hypothetical protein [Microcella frigidaquae]|uniref:VapC45 PIN like domain-containing protein n=1 Tax=Microcella frigidaquae TaxID=424758 RepID=A0A840XJS9_9MICO|nr:hypothetical protein [Microcella frigidaquae]MBB5616928.1 hypothetical protein [Microcella frigidaquae]NHN43638.1 hypothetical protein [Microcella frigidaquae]